MLLLDIKCSSVELNSIMYIVKNILLAITIIAPILMIIMFAILLTRMTINPDNKKLMGNLKNMIHALLFIFFIPLIINILMYALGDNTDISRCYTSSTKIDPNATYVAVEEDGKINIVNQDDYEDAYIHQLDFSCKSNVLKAQFSCETIHIVEHNFLDMNYYTKDQIVGKYGGFDKYINHLGGIFKEYYNKELETPTKAIEFQRISEYVFGLMTIHGFDYYNGSTMDNFDDDTKYCKWGGSCIFLKDIAEAKEEAKRKSEETGETVEPDIVYPTGSSDAFYPGQMMYADSGSMNGKKFDQGIAGKNMTTNCNNSVDMVYYKAKILGTKERPYSSADWSAQVKDKNNKVVTDFKDLQIGDILHFFKQEVDSSNPSTWGSWGHVAYVGEIDYKKGIITAYDGGSYFTSNRNHKWTFDRNNTTKSLFGFEGWGAVHLIDLK